MREWLARASRAPRDPAWIADGVISDRWAPVSPVSGRLDAFVWGTPVEQLQGYDPDRPAPGDRARFALSASDAVMGDVHEAVALAPPHEDSAGKDAVPASEKLHRVDAPAAVPQEPAHPPMPAAARVEPAKPQPARVEAVRPNGEAADAPDLQPAPPPVQSVAPEAHEETHGDGRPAQPGYVDRPRFTTPDPSRETQAAVGPNPGEAIPHRAVDAVSASPTPQAAIQASPAPEPPVRPAASASNVRRSSAPAPVIFPLPTRPTILAPRPAKASPGRELGFFNKGNGVQSFGTIEWPMEPAPQLANHGR